jgi:hypothetical protein
VPTKQATLVLIKVKSCNASLRTLLVCIRVCLKPFLRYEFLISDTYHLGSLREQGCEDPWLFFGAKRCLRATKFRKQYARACLGMLGPNYIFYRPVDCVGSHWFVVDMSESRSLRDEKKLAHSHVKILVTNTVFCST